MRSKPIGERKPNGDGRTAEQKLYEAALEAESRTAEAQAGSLILERLKADIGSLPATNPYREGALKAFSAADLGKQAERVYTVRYRLRRKFPKGALPV